MPRIFEITDGTKTVNLINPAATGIIARAGGFGMSRFAPHQLDASGALEAQIFTEQWNLDIKGSSHDNLATQTRDLIELLRKAWRFHNDPTQRVPVYLKQQTTGETNPRYALVYQSPEISNPDFMDVPFEAVNLIEDYGVTIHRFMWRSGIPGVLPTAATLGYDATGMPASPTTVHLSNAREGSGAGLEIDTIWNYDNSAAAFSPNFADTASWSLWSVSGSVPAVQDIIYLGGNAADTDILTRHFLLTITTAGVFSGNLLVEYWNGTLWQTLVQGTSLLIYPQSITDNLFKSTGEWVVMFQPPTDMVSISINGAVRQYIRIRISGLSSWTTTPVHGTSAPAAVRSNAFSIPAAATKGDISPLVNLRILTPSGGDNSEGFGNTSRIVLGAKSSPGSFVSDLILNTGANLATGWTGALLTDTTVVATDRRGIIGRHANCTFATNATMIARARLTGTNVLPDYLGKYRIFVRAQQIGGAVGDTQIKVVAFVHENFVYSPKFETPTVKLAAVAAGLEVVDLGQISIPFSEAISTDVFTGGELYFELHAERTTGASTLRLYDMILIPIDLWSVELDDPVSDITSGATALRGGSVLDCDGGVMVDRTVKYFNSGGTLYIASRWGRGGSPMKLDPGVVTGVYCLMMSYPTTFGTPPMVAELGMHMAVQVYVHNQYLGLRGSD